MWEEDKRSLKVMKWWNAAFEFGDGF